MFELIKKYCKMGIYGQRELELFVVHGDITREQAEEILAGLPPSMD